MPEVASLAELNEHIKAWEADDDRRRISGKLTTIGDDYATERDLLAPLPTEAFDPGLVLHPRVDRSSMITVRMMKYSVPEYLKLWGPPDRAVGDHRYCLWGPAAVDLGATGRPSAHRHGFKAACSLML
ncbi:Mobile element protein [Brevibacterium aurantiacum]|uniref:Mobile element protein n=1 Tax=Brevibacterium aurantiacum TaxID=273384 RepID=A0A1D7W2F3_BREAU|nr:Mobile element protein [Brevibacterium aurantiacum]